MLQSKFWVFIVFLIGVPMIFSTTDVGPTCESNDDCSINNTACTNSTCQCTEGFIYSGDGTKCLEVVKSLGAACQESQQCSAFLFAGGFCYRGFCDCAPGYHYLHGRCWRSLDLGNKCLSSSNCYVNSDVVAAGCYNNTCQCTDGYYQREYRSCRRKATGVGDDCAIDLDCQYETLKNLTCDKTRKCVESPNTKLIKTDIEHNETEGIVHVSRNQTDRKICQRANFYSEEEDKCVAEIGEPCKPDDKASIKNSICLDNHWKCKVAFVPTRNNRQCKKATTEFLKSCLFDEQCYIFGPDAKCTLQRCSCNYKSHFIAEQSFCWMTKRPGESCQVDYDCYDQGLGIESKCNNKICDCPSNHHINSQNHCVKDVKAIGDRCTELADCSVLPHTVCNESACLCEDNYYEVAGQCVPGINTFCNSSIPCLPENSYCESGVCNCYDEFVAISAELCAPIVDNGDNCTYSAQCESLDPHSYCSTDEKVCTCQDSFFFNYGKCFKRRVLGEKCNSIGECYVRTHPSTVLCRNGVCECNNVEKFDSTYCGDNATNVFISFWMILTITAIKFLF